MPDGKYHAFEYVPVGKGARTGRGVEQWKLGRVVKFTKRSTAKARAIQWRDRARARTAGVA
jgi:hypothetical protein